MATTQDASIGSKIEATFGSAVAVDRFYEFTDEGFEFEPDRQVGAGLRVGGRVARAGRRVEVKRAGTGSLELEMTTKGLGTLLQAAMGSGASALVSGSTYQQTFTLGASNANLPSMTFQKGVPDASGTVQAFTFAGCTCSEFEISLDNAGMAMLSTSWLSRSLTVNGAGANSYQTPSYVSSPNLYHFGQAAMTLGGTVTMPTSTTLASGGTAVSNVRSFSLSVDNAITDDRYAIGGAGLMSQPTVGLREVTGQMTVEFTDTTITAAYLADTEMALTLTLTSSEALSTGNATLQIVIPAVRLNGAVPTVGDTDLVTYDVEFSVLDNLTAAQPLWVILRTADTAL